MTERQEADAKPLMLGSDSVQAFKHYPVSSKAYRRKDYEYISSFNFTVSSNLKACRGNTQHQHQRYDAESDCLLTQSSTGTQASTTFSSSTTSTSTESYGNSPNSGDFVNNVIDSFNSLHVVENIQEPESETEENASDGTGDTCHEKCCVLVNEVVDEVSQPQTTPKRENVLPTVLPVFGDWDTSELESYTDVFQKLRDKKKLEGLLVSPSSLGNIEQEVAPVKVQSTKPINETAKPKHSSQHDHIQHQSKSKGSFFLLLRRNK